MAVGEGRSEAAKPQGRIEDIAACLFVIAKSVHVSPHLWMMLTIFASDENLRSQHSDPLNGSSRLTKP
jgi:hypothetical protein